MPERWQTTSLVLVAAYAHEVPERYGKQITYKKLVTDYPNDVSDRMGSWVPERW